MPHALRLISAADLPDLRSPAKEPLRYGMIQLLLTLPVLWAGRDFYSKGLFTIYHLNPNMDTLIGVGTAAAFGHSCSRADRTIDYDCNP